MNNSSFVDGSISRANCACNRDWKTETTSLAHTPATTFAEMFAVSITL
jgi:hypothetical protein